MAKEAVLFAEIHNKEPTYVGRKRKEFEFGTRENVTRFADWGIISHLGDELPKCRFLN